MRRVQGTVAAFVFSVGVAAAAPTPEQLKLGQLAGIFESKLKEYDATLQHELQAWPRSYLAALSALQAQMQRQGNLEGWEAVKSEHSRFVSASQLDEDLIATSPRSVQEVQRMYTAQRTAVQQQYYRSVLDLQGMYVQNLEGLKRSWTQAGRFDAAMEAKAAIDAVAAHPAVSAASFAMADLAASQTADPGVAASPQEPPPEGGEGGGEPGRGKDEHAATDAGVSTINEVQVYAGVRPPSSGDGFVYKRQVLSRTENSPLVGGVSVACWEGRKDNNTSTGRFGFYTSRSTKEQRFVRVQLNVPQGASAAQLHVELRHFAKNVSGSSSGSRAEPIAFTEQDVDLPPVGALSVVLDFPGVSVSSAKGRYASRYHQSEAHRSGATYYGFVLTIKQAGKIIYQGVSVTQLKDQL